jgi:hypothetical protein
VVKYLFVTHFVSRFPLGLYFLGSAKLMMDIDT